MHTITTVMLTFLFSVHIPYNFPMHSYTVWSGLHVPHGITMLSIIIIVLLLFTALCSGKPFRMFRVEVLWQQSQPLVDTDEYPEVSLLQKGHSNWCHCVNILTVHIPLMVHSDHWIIATSVLYHHWHKAYSVYINALFTVLLIKFTSLANYLSCDKITLQILETIIWKVCFWWRFIKP